VMVSTLTQEGAETTLDALAMGAFDCVGKPTIGQTTQGFSELVDKVKAASKSRIRPMGDRVGSARHGGSFNPGDRVVAIGSSTGGVEALMTLIGSFPANCPPTVITQHMPATFTQSFAARMDRASAPTVREATDGAQLGVGQVYLAPGGERHMEIVRSAGGYRCRLRADDPVSGHRPSVDVLFNSVAQAAGADSVGVILTGMGRDGAQGLKAMRDAGAHTLGQDEATCVVYGMPKSAFELGAVERQAPIHKIGPAVLDLCSRQLRESA
jgi:two-component system chemotaxis response regulator CheB